MANPIIKIPTPCHQSWQDMTPVEKGRFCAACRKTVQDFTMSTDIEIAKAYRENKNMCGRFLTSQLDRELIIPKEKSNYWAAAGAAVISFLGAGTQFAETQGEPRMEQTERKTITSALQQAIDSISGPYKIQGIVLNPVDLTPAAGASIYNYSTNQKTVTDSLGNFTLIVNTGDYIGGFYNNWLSPRILIEKNITYYKIIPNNIEKPLAIRVGGAYTYRSPSIFTRTWRRIKYVFRKH